jgi:hypothetical protein
LGVCIEFDLLDAAVSCSNRSVYNVHQLGQLQFDRQGEFTMGLVIIRICSMVLCALGMTTLYLVATLFIGHLVMEMTGNLSTVENVVSFALIVMCAGTGYYTAHRVTDRTF